MEGNPENAPSYPPEVSVIIPSFDGVRGGNVEKLKNQLQAQTLKPREVIVVTAVSPNGKARNEGVKKASGEFYVFIDDDVTLGHDKLIENLVRPFFEVKNLGMTGPSQLIPEDSTWFQKAAARQLPRSIFPVQQELVDSDMATHMCLCMPAQLFKDVGWENPDIISGTDPDLRHRVRKAGFRVCVVPDSWAYHPMPACFPDLMRLSYVKGKNSAIVRRTHPGLVLELDEGFKKDFPERRALVFRICRAFILLLISFFTLKLLKFSAIAAYVAGNIAGSLKRISESSRRMTD